MSENEHDTCVIGAGPAGLAVARALAERQLPYTHIDYPPHRQILSCLTSFAEAHGLTDRIEFGTEVRGVEKNPDGTWTLTRADGRVSTHRQVVVCTGSQWHPKADRAASQAMSACKSRSGSSARST